MLILLIDTRPSDLKNMNSWEKNYKNKKVLITGGMGFIGSTLAIALVKAGAKVNIVDSMIPEYGGNLWNIESIKDDIKINYCDITDRTAMEWVVRDREYIFHLAGQVSHIMSYSNPYADIDYNITGTVALVEACRKYNPNAIIIYTGTRGQYGPADVLPVSEDAPTNPKGLYEITNLAAEKILIAYNNSHKIRSVLTRLTNIYGPRAQMKTNKYGVANWFIRLSLEGGTIPLFGDGLIKRDFLYVDDVISALCMLPLKKECFGEVFNVGGSEISNFKELAETIVGITKKGSIVYTPFSEERKKQEPGDFYSDISKIKKYIGWEPKVMLSEGVEKTVSFYKKNRKHYW